MRNLCCGSWFRILESDVIDKGVGSVVDAKYFFLECSKKTLSWGPVWNMSWGWVDEPCTNHFGKGQPQAEVFTAQKRINRLSIRTVLHGRDRELWTCDTGSELTWAGRVTSSLWGLGLWVDRQHSQCWQVPRCPVPEVSEIETRTMMALLSVFSVLEKRLGPVTASGRLSVVLWSNRQTGK